MVTMYYRGSSGAVIVYDITSKKSFENVRTWLKDLRQNVPDVAVAVIGNKLDLEKHRAVQKSELMELAKELKINVYEEVSAKTGDSIKSTFIKLSQVMKPVERNESAHIEHKQLEEQNETSSCC